MCWFVSVLWTLICFYPPIGFEDVPAEDVLFLIENRSNHFFFRILITVIVVLAEGKDEIESIDVEVFVGDWRWNLIEIALEGDIHVRDFEQFIHEQVESNV